MPDLIVVFSRWWKFIIGLSILAGVVALIACLVSPKEYLSTATALPANSMTADKARIFNNNIEALYSDFGTPDELDRIEGTAVLDTIFIAAAQEFNLAEHYNLPSSGESGYKAAVKLKKNSKISRSAYGELKVKVWDRDRNMAASLSNALLDKIQALHQHLQNENNAAVLQKVKEDYARKQQQYKATVDSLKGGSGADNDIAQAKKTALLEQLQQYEKLVDQYQLALSTNPPVLLTVEKARPSLWADKPKTAEIVLLTFFATLLVSFLAALFFHSRKP